MKLANYPILKDADLDRFVDASFNLMIIGSHGTGKTERVLNCLQRNQLNYVYFSGSTLDPWIDFIGIPSKGEGGVMEFIRPSQINSELEAIFIDEYNRSPKEVRNAIMELVQFKTMNGMHFPELKFVWAAVNPPADADDAESVDYDVEEIDPAQLDRFQAIVRVPDKPCARWFRQKYGEQGAIAVKWWGEQARAARKDISPRRLDYALDAFGRHLPISNVLPKSSNIKKLTVDLNTDPAEKCWLAFVDNPNEENAAAMLAFRDLSKMNRMFKIPELVPYTLMCPEDLVTDHYFRSSEYRAVFNVLVLCNKAGFVKLFESLKKSHPRRKEFQIFRKIEALARTVPDFQPTEASSEEPYFISIDSLANVLRKKYFNTYDRGKALSLLFEHKKPGLLPYSESLVELLASFKGMQSAGIARDSKRIEKLFSNLDPRFYKKKKIKEAITRFERDFGFSIQKPAEERGLKALLTKYWELEKIVLQAKAA